MREIKFRAWNKRIKKIESVINLDWFSEEGSLDKVDIVTPLAQVRDELILMQFTGLHDKNGKEIFQSDLWKLGDKIYLIIWNEGDFQTGWKKKAGDNLTDIGKDNACQGEVIGNIYSNPELLKEAHEKTNR